MKLKIFIISLIICAFVFSNFNSAIYAQEKKLNKKQLNEVKELLMLIDIIDIHLQKAWNTENDYGLATEKDKTYFKNVINVSIQIAKRLDNLPKGDDSFRLICCLTAYTDVGHIRILTTEDDGYEQQAEIAKRYGLQDKEPHLWAYTIWMVARELRNLAAKDLSLPTIKYPKD
jgi:hypothetical protein